MQKIMEYLSESSIIKSSDNICSLNLSFKDKVVNFPFDIKVMGSDFPKRFLLTDKIDVENYFIGCRKTFLSDNEFNLEQENIYQNLHMGFSMHYIDYDEISEKVSVFSLVDLCFKIFDDSAYVFEVQGLNQFWKKNQRRRNGKLISKIAWDKLLLYTTMDFVFNYGGDFVYFQGAINNEWVLRTYESLKNKGLIGSMTFDSFLAMKDTDIKKIREQYRKEGLEKRDIDTYYSENITFLRKEAENYYLNELKKFSGEGLDKMIEERMYELAVQNASLFHMLPEVACRRYIDLPLSMGFSVCDDGNFVFTRDDWFKMLR